tara:strand:+ start:5452 stop:5835 length:384 start_codon:yes stop_codon:yes gene_type:complete
MRFFIIIFLFTISIFGIYSCAPKPKLEVPEAYKAGQNAFHKICSNCHGSDAMGKHTQAPRLIDQEYLAPNFKDEDIRETVINGTDKMPSQKKNVTDKEITEIIKYLRYSQKAAGLEAEEEEEEEDEG